MRLFEEPVPISDNNIGYSIKLKIKPITGMGALYLLGVKHDSDYSVRVVFIHINVILRT